MNADGSKLSKRQNDIKLEYYRNRGVFPEALINYITQAGGGFDRSPEERSLCYDMSDLIKKFDITRINSNSSRLNPDLLDDLNKLQLGKCLEDPEKSKELIEKVRQMIKEKYPLSADELDLDDDHIYDILKWSVKRISTIDELIGENLSFLWVLPTIAKGKDIMIDESKFKM